MSIGPGTDTILGINYLIERLLCNMCTSLASLTVYHLSNIQRHSNDSELGLPRPARASKASIGVLSHLQFIMHILIKWGALYLATAIAHFVVLFTPDSSL